MTDTTPTTDIIIPPEVAALLDEASTPGGNLRASPTNTSIQLVNPKNGAIVREVQWAEAGIWARRVLQASLANVPNE